MSLPAKDDINVSAISAFGMEFYEEMIVDNLKTDYSLKKYLKIYFEAGTFVMSFCVNLILRLNNPEKGSLFGFFCGRGKAENVQINRRSNENTSKIISIKPFFLWRSTATTLREILFSLKLSNKSSQMVLDLHLGDFTQLDYCHVFVVA